MAADNHTTIVGNLVEDPEVRFTNNGIAVANLRVAVTPTRPAGRPVARRRDQLL
jgi:single-stranded DNA-binding protein